MCKQSTKTEYKGVIIELANDGSWFNVYEITPIFKNECMVLCGATTQQGKKYTLDDIKQKIDAALGAIC